MGSCLLVGAGETGLPLVGPTVTALIRSLCFALPSVANGVLLDYVASCCPCWRTIISLAYLCFFFSFRSQLFTVLVGKHVEQMKPQINWATWWKMRLLR
ncbi:hypothetical protein EDD18DRAFT_91279 [Armillaria luteobubalina]|uniref:Uncharacterized protein n=1 Tax=Armillaria luteobubalina TaxID=153913 RepID=A0AA39QAD9_9AGAR|nr:hypothetical protein EDD18DRAFT_91279 [Armillaria luteobubalina]